MAGLPVRYDTLSIEKAMLRFDRPKPKMRSFRLHRGGPLTELGSFFVLVYVLPVVIVAVAALIGWLRG